MRENKKNLPHQPTIGVKNQILIPDWTYFWHHPSYRAVPNPTLGRQINMTFLVEFLLNWGR